MRQKAYSWKRFIESKDEKLDVEDMISRLPETVLHHIKSFLLPSDKDRVRLLSRKWRRLNVQDQKVLILYSHQLNESEFLKILNDDFHSLINLTLRKCSGMRSLKLVNFKLENLELNYCGSLKNLHLNTPKLGSLCFRGRRDSPCVIEFINCKILKVLHLVGVAMDTMMLKRCNESLPVLQVLTLSGCDMSGNIEISSNSIKTLSLLRFNNPVGLSIDATSLVVLKYSGSIIVPFQNINCPSLDMVGIELNTSRYKKRDLIWFTGLVQMLHCLKHTKSLDVHTNSEKSIIIPKQLREIIVPPLDGMDSIGVFVNSRSSNIVDLVDSFLWICPRVNQLFFCSTFRYSSLQVQSRFMDTGHVSLMGYQLRHRELSSGTPDNSCGFCLLHPSRCWRHSLIEYTIMDTHDESKEKMISYIRMNLEIVGQNATLGH